MLLPRAAPSRQAWAISKVSKSRTSQQDLSARYVRHAHKTNPSARLPNVVRSVRLEAYAPGTLLSVGCAGTYQCTSSVRILRSGTAKDIAGILEHDDVVQGDDINHRLVGSLTSA